MTNRRSMRVSLAVVAVAVVLSVALLMWPRVDAPTPTAGVDRPREATSAPREQVDGPVVHRVAAAVHVRLLDAATKLPLADTAIRCDSGSGSQSVRTTSEGEFEAGPGPLQVQPVDAELFDPVSVEVAPGTQVLEVACRFRVRLSGSDGMVAVLKELLPGEDEDRSSGGLRLGPALTQWRVPGSYSWPTTLRPLVVEVERGSIRPAHPVWAGETIVEDGTQRVMPPTSVGPARVSRVVRGVAGSVHEFAIDPDPLALRLEYVLASPATGPGIVELMAVRGFGAEHRVVAFFDRRAVEAGQAMVAFDSVAAGEYVVRSCVRRDTWVGLAWQWVEVGPGPRHVVAERDGEGAGKLWFEVDTKPLMVVSLLLDQDLHGIAVSYPAFDLGGALCLQGLHGTTGSIRIHDRRIADSERYPFDLGVRSTIRLGK